VLPPVRFAAPIRFFGGRLAALREGASGFFFGGWTFAATAVGGIEDAVGADSIKEVTAACSSSRRTLL
jgi:ABC-type thiamin/hydroxymethylpyrimidine transport system permease subunit